MPTQTFFRLPAEKREKLLCAARAEFSRVPYADASINKIVQAASIPRGSFYMYFEDKADLFRYLVREFQSWLIQQLSAQLRLRGGDLFAVFLDFFDQFCALPSADAQTLPVRSFLALLQKNAGIRSDLICPLSSGEGTDRLLALVDRDLLDVKDSGELEDLFFFLMGAAGDALAALLNGGDPVVLRPQYQSRLALLQRGAARRKADAASEFA